MLQLIREKTTGWIATAIVALLIIPFAFWGINYYFTGGSEIMVAKVNGESITMAKFQRTLSNFRQQLRSQPGFNIDAQDEDLLKRLTLDKLVENELLNQIATAAGLRVSDQVIRETIRNIEVFKRDGKFSHAFYRESIARSGVDPEVFEEQLRSDMMAEQLQSAIVESEFITPQTVDSAARLFYQKRDLRYAILPLADYQDTITVSEPELEKFYQDNSRLYIRPEQVRIAYIHLQASMLADRVEVEEEDLREFYASNKASYDVAEQRQINEIRILTEKEATPEAIAAAREKAESLLTEIRSGKSLADMAKTHGQDTGPKLTLQEFNFIGKGLLPGPVDQVAFNLEPGTISDVIQSEEGFHIIEVKETRGGALNTFENARENVEKDYRLKQADKIFYDLADDLATQAFENPDTLEVAAEETGLPVQESSFFSREGTKDGLTSSRKLIDASFSEDVLQQGHNSEVLEIGDGEVAVVRLLEHIPEAVSPLAEVREQALADIKFRRGSELAEQAGREVLADLQGGKSMDDVATARNITWQTAAGVTRTDVSVNRAILRAAFQLGRPQNQTPLYGGIPLGSGDYALVAVMDVQEPDSTAVKEKELGNIRDQLQAARMGLSWQEYLANRKRDAAIELFPATFQGGSE